MYHKYLSYFFLVVTYLLCNSNLHAQKSEKRDSSKIQVEQLIKDNNTEKAIVLALEQLEKASIKDLNEQIYWNAKVGKILRINQNYSKSLVYLSKVKKLSDQSKDSTKIANALFEIGSLNLLMYSLEVTKKQKFDVALKERDSAFSIFKNLIKNYSQIPNTEAILGKTYANLTGLYSYIQDHESADKMGEKAIEYFTKIKDTMSVIGVRSNLAISQVYRQEYEKAEQNYLEAIPLLKDTSNLKILNMKAIQYSNLSDLYERQGNYNKSLETLKKAHSLYNIHKEKYLNHTVSEIEAKYSKEKAIATEVKKRKEMQLFFSIIGAIALIILISGLILYRNSKLKAKNLALVLEKNKLEKLNEIEKIQNENSNKVIAATLDGRLKERKNISQILHNSVNSLLSSANLHLQVVKKKSSDSIDELEKSTRIINEASDKVRDLSHTLISDVLINFGLSYALEDLCEKYSNDQLTFSFHKGTYLVRLEQDFEIKINNIVEEIVNNIIKHSQATKASINLNQDQNQLIINITDNGIGFESSNELHEGIGINQIKARVKNLKGTISINSSNENGTNVIIKVPIVNR
ncbi:ATP-binding protein [Pseudofulvibacter geojedonensis]|uniref:histidine kinase n=1 Tax=Pseudofulvibacter geojedonensis TaxID=1123758 RepID=A0ABW3I063_9FLAO